MKALLLYSLHFDNSFLMRMYITTKIIFKQQAILPKNFSTSVTSVLTDKQNKNTLLNFLSRKVATQNISKDHIILKGWVKQINRSEEGVTVNIDDGVSPNDTKVLITKDIFKKKIQTGTPLVIKTIKNDLQTNIATEVNVKGKRCKMYENSKYLKNFESLDSSNHLFKPSPRSKFSFYRTRFRIRSKLKSLLHNYYNENGYIEVDTPILSRYIKDSHQKTFYVEPTAYKRFKDPIASFFGGPVYLSTCGQIHMECITSAISKAYSIKPIFRRFQSSGKFLFEFWRADCEELYTEEGKLNAFENMLTNVEKLLKYLLKSIIDEHLSEMQLSEEGEKVIKNVLDKKWVVLPYSEAIKILLENKEKVNYPVEYGMEFGMMCLRLFPKIFDGSPVFICDFPYFRKSFNVSLIEDSTNVFAFDLIFPRGVEIANGSIKEHDFNILQQRLEEFGALQYYDWFANMRKWGVGPTRGYSIGIERFLYFMFNDSNIKNVIPFPR